MASTDSSVSEAQAVERTLRSVEAALHVVRMDSVLSASTRSYAERELHDVIRALVQAMAPPAHDRLF